MPRQSQSTDLCDGELVVYRPSYSLLFRCRYKLTDGTWMSQKTGKAALEHAIDHAWDI